MKRALNLPAVLILMGLALLAAVVVSERIVDPTPSKTPSVILIVLDTVRPDHLSAYGYSRTTSPRLEVLCAKGVRFEHARAAAPWTLPSHASLFTGLLPTEHGCHWEHRFLNDSHETLAERLFARGYKTGGFTENVNTGKDFNLHQGFETFLETWKERKNSPQTPDTEITCREVMRWMDGVVEDEPYFLFVNFMSAHLPYVPPRPERDAFYSADRGAPRAAHHEDLLEWVMRGDVVVDDEIRRELVDLYDGELLYLDRVLQGLLTSLEDSGRLENTLVIITSDHGETVGEAGRVDHQLSVAEHLIRVPLIAVWAGHLPKGGVVSEPVSLVSLYDAILNAGPFADAGRQFVEDLTGPARRGEPLISEFMRPIGLISRMQGHVKNPVYAEDASLFERRRALLLAEHGRSLKLVDVGDQSFLFDVLRDPNENVPLDEPWNVDRLETIASTAYARMVSFEEGGDEGGGAPLDEETRQILESLGYVGAGAPSKTVGHHASEHVALGLFHLNQEDPEAAARDFTRAMALAPTAVEPRFFRARALDQMGDPRAAAEYRDYLDIAARGREANLGGDESALEPLARLEWVRRRLESLGK